MKLLLPKKYFLTFLLAAQLITSLNPGPALAQTPALKSDSPSIFEKAGDGLMSLASTILTLNNPVRLEETKPVFKGAESPEFSLLVPQKSKDKIGESTNEKWQTNSRG